MSNVILNDEYKYTTINNYPTEDLNRKFILFLAQIQPNPLGGLTWHLRLSVNQLVPAVG